MYGAQLNDQIEVDQNVMLFYSLGLSMHVSSVFGTRSYLFLAIILQISLIIDNFLDVPKNVAAFVLIHHSSQNGHDEGVFLVVDFPFLHLPVNLDQNMLISDLLLEFFDPLGHKLILNLPIIQLHNGLEKPSRFAA